MERYTFKLLSMSFTFFFFFFFPSISYSHFSIISSGIIQGTRPIFIANSSEDYLGFSIADTLYNERLGNITSAAIKKFDKNITLNDFSIKMLNVTDFNFDPALNYSDNDGDVVKKSEGGTFTIGQTSFTWHDNLGNEIPTSQYDKPIGCNSGLNMPLTLTITVDDVQVHSEYGVPRDSEKAQLTKIYRIMPYSEICFAKPNQMIVNHGQTWGSPDKFIYKGRTDCILSGYTDMDFTNNDPNRGNNGWNTQGYETRDPLCGGGYDKNVFDSENGFYASANPTFPTTGFPGAEFQLIMTGSQSDWLYSVKASPAGSVTVDNYGKVLLNSKPSGAVTITAKFKPDTSIEHNYTFTPSKIWAIPQGEINASLEQAINICGGINNIPTRAEMTNSPNADSSWKDYPLQWEMFTRTINQGLLSEWGMAGHRNYPNSKWSDTFYWFHSSEPFMNDNPKDYYAIDAWIGQIGTMRDFKDSLHVVCKS